MTAAFTVELGSGAESDLDAITDYLIDAVGADKAIAFVDAMLERVASLSQLPFGGPAPRELDVLGEDDFRQLLFGRCRIFYEVNDATVIVVLIADGRRDMQVLLNDRLLVGRKRE